MMSKTNYMDRYCREYVHELEDSSLSVVLSEYKIMFRIHDDYTVDELRCKIEEMGIEIIGGMNIEVAEDGFFPDYITISTDTDIDDELYAKLYEFSCRNGFDIDVYVHQEHISTRINGIMTQQYYHELEMDCVEADVWMKMLKEDDPEEWARIQVENVS